jgi:hypothetical protein
MKQFDEALTMLPIAGPSDEQAKKTIEAFADKAREYGDSVKQYLA